MTLGKACLVSLGEVPAWFLVEGGPRPSSPCVTSTSRIVRWGFGKRDTVDGFRYAAGSGVATDAATMEERDVETGVDRRKFLKYTGVAGAATGVAWVTPSVLGSTSAFAAGSVARCSDSQTLHWSNYRPNRAADAHEPDHEGTISFTMKVDAVGANPDIWVKATVTAVASNLLADGSSSTSVYPARGDNNSGYPNPTAGGINNRFLSSSGESHTFNGYDSYYILVMKCTRQSGYDMTFEFFSDSGLTTPINVFDLNFKLIDIDRQTSGNTYNDRLFVNPDSGFSQNKGSNVGGGGTAMNSWVGTAEGVTDDTGTVEVTYDGGPVNAFTFSYRAVDYTNNYNQYVAISDLTWC